MKKFRTLAIIAAGLVLTACGKEQGEPAAATTDELPACEAQAVSDVQVVEIAPGLSGKTFSIGCGVAAVLLHFDAIRVEGVASEFMYPPTATHRIERHSPIAWHPLRDEDPQLGEDFVGVGSEIPWRFGDRGHAVASCTLT